MNNINWNDIKRVHIVGIGGIGLSALARLLSEEGKIVTGCERSPSVVTELLEKFGIEVQVGHASAHISAETDLVIYTDAIFEGTEGNIERVQARKLHVPELSYFQALGQIANRSQVIAVAGAHGKTTTTAMLTDVLEDAGLDPRAVIGSLRVKTKSNFRAGNGACFVVEADEYQRHFLEFTPFVLVITNIDADHLDYYRDLADIQSAFRELAEKIPQSGFLICDATHVNLQPVIAGLSCSVIDYRPYFDPSLPLKVLAHNRINAAAVCAVADVLQINKMSARISLEKFSGVWRRFEYKGTMKNGALVYDDYGHHPMEIKTTLKSVREQFPRTHIVVAFHPHLYSRTKALLAEFSEAFSDADQVLIAPIFAAREKPDPAISHHVLARALVEKGVKAQALDSFEDIEEYLLQHTGKDAMVLTMGAGDIYKVGEKLLAI